MNLLHLCRSRRVSCQVMGAMSVALLAPVALAQPTDATQEKLLQCRLIAAPLTRVACYDAIHVAAAIASPSRAVAATPPTQQAPAGAAVAAPARQPADSAAFGLPVREQQAASNALQSMIAGAFDGWMAQSKIRLANGQVWQIADDSEGAYRLRDPKVQIRRSSFGSYFMSIEGVQQTPKVRRVE